LDVVQLGEGVVQKELGEFFDPLIDDDLKVFDEWVRVDLDPTNVGLTSNLANSSFNFIEFSDLFVEHFEGWELGSDTLEDFLCHSIETLHELLSLFVFEVLIVIELLLVGLTKIWARLEEGFKGLLESLLPEEGDVLVLVEMLG
jgi:hypothetical protein